MSSRIPGLDPLTGADLAADDEFVVFDTSADETKRISRSELFGAEEDEILALDNEWTGTNRFDERIYVPADGGAYDEAAGVLNSRVNVSPSGTTTIAAGKQLDVFRMDGTFVLGNGSRYDTFNANVVLDASSNVNSNGYTFVSFLTNNGHGNGKGIYSNVEAGPLSDGAIVSYVSNVTPGALTSLSVGHQMSFDTTNKNADYAYWMQARSGTCNVNYGVLADATVLFATSFIQACGGGAGNFLTLKDGSGSSDRFYVTSAGAVTSVSTISGTVLTGSTSLVASSASNGITITQAAVTRNAAAGSLTVAAGSNAGNSIALATGGSTRLGITDSTVTVTGNLSLTGSVDLGGTDTTVSRASAGDISVEGNLVYRAGGTDVPVTDGGTGASDASGARTNLGVAIGSNVQAWSAKLDSLAAQTWAADTISYQTSSSAVSTTSLTSVARTLIGQSTQALMRTTGLGVTATGDSLITAASVAAARAALALDTGDSPVFTTVRGSTSVIAASATNGVTITQAAVSRNAAAGSLTVEAGTDAGNSIAMKTGGSTRLGITDSTVTVTGDVTTTGVINLGGTDTTLARDAAGDFSVEGNRVYRAGGTDVALADGGSGQSTAPEAFDAVSGNRGVRELFRLTIDSQNTTSDQSLTKIGTFTNYEITAIRYKNSNGSVAAMVGQLYATSSGGTSLSGSVTFTNVNAANKGQGGSIANDGDALLSAALVWRNTVAAAANNTVDIVVYGVKKS